MLLQKIQRIQAVAKTGTVTKNPATKRTLEPVLQPRDHRCVACHHRARRSVKERPRALVTGGAVRVGRAIALALARAGMDVAIGYHRSARPPPGPRASSRALGVRAVACAPTSPRPAAAAPLVRQAAAALGGLDVLVNSAAVFARTPSHRQPPRQYDRFLDLNLRGAFFCAQAAARVMAPGGHIVNIGDVAASRAWPGTSPTRSPRRASWRSPGASRWRCARGASR